MLDDTLKEDIQTAYTRLLDAKGYRARRCQKEMIADIARTLGDEDSGQHICVVEAGTGTGKTIAYALAAIPIARQFKKKIVIATATIALQEQIVFQDLPDIRLHSGLDFSFALAKGRRRYLCLARLDNALNESGGPGQTLLELSPGEPGGDAGPLFDGMIEKLGRGEWDGERDSWPEEIEEVTWSRVSTDHAQCTRSQCSHFENCYFYRARENIHRVDCIVTNQDLVLSDLMMGGGAVLPAPEETIYIIDEAHHLPEKAGNHFSSTAALYATRNWLLQLPSSIRLAAAVVPTIGSDVLAVADSRVERGAEMLGDLAALLQSRQQEADKVDDGWLLRFPLGRVDPGLAEASASLAVLFDELAAMTDSARDSMEAVLEDRKPSEREELEQWLSLFGSATSRLEAAAALWHNFAKEAPEPPAARWIRFMVNSQVEGMEMQLSSHPVSVADSLTSVLWERCAGAVLTSATLSVAGDFSNLQARTGIDPGQCFDALRSPFHFGEQGVLHVPAMESDPGSADEHTDEISTLIPALVEQNTGSLVLFTSWRQMLRVHDDLEDGFRDRVLLQGDLSKMEILQRHRNRVDSGEPSCIFGLASFAEGVDLPGDYCSHVVIAKIPFAVPDDPVAATLSEWVEARGGNAFQEVMLPGAVLRMVQAAGRLLRTETDAGQVSILDRRILTRSYGRLIMKALPPFRRDIH